MSDVIAGSLVIPSLLTATDAPGLLDLLAGVTKAGRLAHLNLWRNSKQCLRHTGAGLTVVADTAATVFTGMEAASLGLLALIDGLLAVAEGTGIAVTER